MLKLRRSEDNNEDRRTTIDCRLRNKNRIRKQSNRRNEHVKSLGGNVDSKGGSNAGRKRESGSCFTRGQACSHDVPKRRGAKA